MIIQHFKPPDFQFKHNCFIGKSIAMKDLSKLKCNMCSTDLLLKFTLPTQMGN